MRAKFRIRFKLPPLEPTDSWAIMLNQIMEEEAFTADRVWEGLNEENQELLRRSQVVPTLLKILIDAREQKKWTQNPLMAMISYKHMIMILQPPNWDTYLEMIQDSAIKFKLHEIEPKVANQEVSDRISALSYQVERIRQLKREYSQSD
jgi:hypothetical protein